jgi:RNA polymerase sigma factor (sigma-70 family)
MRLPGFQKKYLRLPNLPAPEDHLIYLLNAEPLHIPGHADGNSHESDLSTLLEGCLRNDRASQEKLYRRYFSTMMNMIRRYTGDADTARDILNNGFLKAFQKIGQYGHYGSFEGWLRKIMTRAVAEHFRSNKSRPEIISTEALPEHITQYEGHHPLEYKDLLALLQRLPPATRLVVNLFMIEGYTHKEIAELAGISTGTSKWHVAEGKRLLQRLLPKGSFHDKQSSPDE